MPAGDAPLADRAVLEPVRQAMRDGLTRAAALDVGRGYVDATAGVSNAGGFLRIEAGLHPLQPFALFAYGEARPMTSSYEAGVGARLFW